MATEVEDVDSSSWWRRFLSALLRWWRGSDRQDRDATLLLTYRFLRLGIVAAAVTLGASLAFEIFVNADVCVRNSVSAYFYSPVRTILTGSLMAVGLCLIAIQGDNDVEEVSLNMAGMLAPMVAVIPTSMSTTCDPVESLSAADRSAAIDAMTTATRDGLQNNAVAYFGVLVVALLILAVRLPTWLVRNPERPWAVRLALIAYLIVVSAFGFAAYRTWDNGSSWAHNLSAILMFVFFAIVVAQNASRDNVSRRYRVLCRIVLVAMAATVGVFVLLRRGGVSWDVFFLEATEIALFTAFWIIQTREFWQRDPVTGNLIADPDPAPSPV